jgi:hypothetical protein
MTATPGKELLTNKLRCRSKSASPRKFSIASKCLLTNDWPQDCKMRSQTQLSPDHVTETKPWWDSSCTCNRTMRSLRAQIVKTRQIWRFLDSGRDNDKTIKLWRWTKWWGRLCWILVAATSIARSTHQLRSWISCLFVSWRTLRFQTTKPNKMKVSPRA